MCNASIVLFEYGIIIHFNGRIDQMCCLKLNKPITKDFAFVKGMLADESDFSYMVTATLENNNVKQRN